MKKLDMITILGIISLGYWCSDVVNNIFFLHNPSWSLWFSSVGIGLTALGLLTRNTFLLSSLFCALFVIEISWNVGFFSHLFFHKSFMGLTDYLFDGQYVLRDFLITSYHIVMLPFLFVAILREKVVHKKAWVGALIYTTIIVGFTYLLSAPYDRTNCVHEIDNCRMFLFFIKDVANPLRSVIAILILTVVIFIPTNYLLVKILEQRKL